MTGPFLSAEAEKQRWLEEEEEEEEETGWGVDNIRWNKGPWTIPERWTGIKKNDR